MSKINQAKFNNVPVTKENIKTWVKKDIETLYSLAYEMLTTPDVMDVLAEKLYQRHLQKAAEADQLAEEVEQSEIEANA